MSNARKHISKFLPRRRKEQKEDRSIRSCAHFFVSEVALSGRGMLMGPTRISSYTNQMMHPQIVQVLKDLGIGLGPCPERSAIGDIVVLCIQPKHSIQRTTIKAVAVDYLSDLYLFEKPSNLREEFIELSLVNIFITYNLSGTLDALPLLKYFSFAYTFLHAGSAIHLNYLIPTSAYSPHRAEPAKCEALDFYNITAARHKPPKKMPRLFSPSMVSQFCNQSKCL